MLDEDSASHEQSSVENPARFLKSMRSNTYSRRIFHSAQEPADKFFFAKSALNTPNQNRMHTPTNDRSSVDDETLLASRKQILTEPNPSLNLEEDPLSTDVDHFSMDKKLPT
ncbi:hypothetical protein Ciccas_008631 [Cichlidogyrus casuarinus]|uniref:Uncharacterized protein n=1 Tax=Cichlidogyrus casuarinus TaxID=1844966 RepID=A0ABD2PZC4_9PLAT